MLTIAGIGDALFDLLPGGPVLGGAPLNVAVMTHQLLARLGGRGIVVSRAGDDDLGRRMAAELEHRGMTAEYLQTDAAHPTGISHVALSTHGEPSYLIQRDVAWDYVDFPPQLERAAAEVDAVCFDSLGQRSATSLASIRQFVQLARPAIRLFDATLRENFFDREIIETSCRLASVVKVNTGELETVCDLLHVGRSLTHAQQARQLIQRFDLDSVVVTRGERGTILFTRARDFEGERIVCEPAPHADSVGAGDACSAGLLVGLLLKWPLEQVVNFANRMGAFVASQPGATPQLP